MLLVCFGDRLRCSAIISLFGFVWKLLNVVLSIKSGDIPRKLPFFVGFIDLGLVCCLTLAQLVLCVF